MRILPFVLAGAVFVLLTLPSASAQQGKLKVVVAWEMDHEMTLPEDGMADMGLSVTLIGKDFVCAQPAAFFVEIIAVNMEKWAGASVVPKSVGPFEFAAGQPGTSEKSVGPKTDAKLNIKWNVEDAPRRDAKNEYVLEPTLKADQTKAGPCQPTYVVDYVKPKPMMVRLPDRIDQERPPGCEFDESLCSSTPTPTIESLSTPGVDPVVSWLALAGIVLLLRRRA